MTDNYNVKLESPFGIALHGRPENLDPAFLCIVQLIKALPQIRFTLTRRVWKFKKYWATLTPGTHSKKKSFKVLLEGDHWLIP